MSFERNVTLSRATAAPGAGGFGLYFTEEEHGPGVALRVLRVCPGGAGNAADIQPGDEIIHVDGERLGGKSVGQLEAKLRSSSSLVVLGVRHSFGEERGEGGGGGSGGGSVGVGVGPGMMPLRELAGRFPTEGGPEPRTVHLWPGWSSGLMVQRIRQGETIIMLVRTHDPPAVGGGSGAEDGGSGGEWNDRSNGSGSGSGISRAGASGSGNSSTASVAATKTSQIAPSGGSSRGGPSPPPPPPRPRHALPSLLSLCCWFETSDRARNVAFSWGQINESGGFQTILPEDDRNGVPGTQVRIERAMQSSAFVFSWKALDKGDTVLKVKFSTSDNEAAAAAVASNAAAAVNAGGAEVPASAVEAPEDSNVPPDWTTVRSGETIMM